MTSTKTILLAIAAVFIGSSSFAQIKKGSVLLGGSFNMGSSKSAYTNETVKNNYGGLNLSAGKAFKDNNVIGVLLNYGSSTYKSDNANTIQQNAQRYGGGFFYRKYKPLGSNFLLFGEGDLSYGRGTETRKNNADSLLSQYKSSNVSSGLTVGVAYQVWRRLNAEVSFPILDLSYNSSRNVGVNSKGFSLNSSFRSQLLNSLSLGFIFVL